MENQAKEWFVVNTYAGHENKVKDNLHKRLETMGIVDNLFRILVAEEAEIEFDKKGKMKTKMHNLYPGYLFVEMIMTDDAWYVVRNTPGVTGFIGSSGGGAKPFPVAQEEIDEILRRIDQAGPVFNVNFKVGDNVRILSGPFKDMEGVIDSMNDQTQVASILVILFGRETPTDIDYNNIDKIIL
jgi:transcriptional antiterminator NusG